ncbi:MAG: hypothetical protein RL885_02510 [Planctomycetota bacterium]
MTFETNSTDIHSPPDLQAVRSRLEGRFSGQVRAGSELLFGRDDSASHWATGVPAFDDLLGGGLLRGTLVELVGRRSSGRWALVLSALATATAGGESAFLVEMGEQLDPQLAEAAGIDLARLLWVSPRWLGDALASAEMGIAAGFPLVVLDLGLPPVRGRRVSPGAWLRLARAAAAQDTVLLVATPYRSSGPAAEQVVTAHRARPLWQGQAQEPPLLTGLESTFELTRQRGSQPAVTSVQTVWTVSERLESVAEPAVAPERKAHHRLA